MLLYTPYASETILQLRQTALLGLTSKEEPALDYLLNLTVVKTMARQIELAARPQALSLLRADPTRLHAWLSQQYPTSRMAIIEALTRTLLALTVE